MLVFGIVIYFSIGVLLAVASFANKSRYGDKKGKLLSPLFIPSWLFVLVAAATVSTYEDIKSNFDAKKQDKKETMLTFYLCLYRIGLISRKTLKKLKTDLRKN